MSLKLIIILLLGLILRLISLDQSLWLDEATSVVVARDFTFSEIITRFSPGDFHPPLYYLMLKVWISVFGSTEVAVRMLSVVFGVATIWVVYKITQKLFAYHISLLASLFFATAPLHIYYSQEARMYVPLTFFAALSVFFFLQIIQEKKSSIFNWLGFIAVNALLLYTDYISIFLFGFYKVYLFLFERDKLVRFAKELFFSSLVTVLLFVPFVPTFVTQLQGGLLVKTNAPEWWKVLGRTNIKELLLVPIKFMIGRISSYDKALYVALVATAGIFYSLLFLRTFIFWNKTKFLWMWLLVPTTSAAIVGMWLSVFSYFRLIFVLPAFYILLATACILLNQKLLKVAVAGVLVVNLFSTGIYLFNPRFHREDWKGAVSYIEKNSQGDAAVVFVSKNQRDPYHYYAKGVPSFGPEGANFGFPKVWLIRYVQPIFDPKDNLRRKIEETGYKKMDEKDFNGVMVWEYEK